MQEHKQIQLYVGLEEGGCVDVGAIKLEGFTLIASSELEALKRQNAALLAERDAFKAQAEALRYAIIIYDDCDTASQSKAACRDMIAKAKAAPRQCLREVQAAAAEKAIQAVLKLPTFTGQKGDWLIKAIAWDEVLPFAKQYAERVKAGEV